MIPLENIPESGILLVTIHFKGYKDNFANDARIALKDGVPKLVKKLNIDIDLTPLIFSLIKTVADDVGKATRSRATGAQYQFGYYGMNSEKFKKIYYELKKLCDGRDWKDEIEIMVAGNVGGLE